jgi:integrase
MNQLLDRWLEVLDVDVSTRRGYLSKIETHIRPLLGSTPVSKVDAEALEPDGSKPLHPDTATQRFDRMATRLGINCTLHSLRHYSATELIAAGVDVRGHGGSEATTLPVYSAWLSEADQRAAATLSARMPPRPRRI